MKSLIIFTLCVVAASVYATNIPITDCGSVDGTIVAIDVTPCDNPTYCSFKKGTSETVTITFTTKTAISSVYANVTGIIEGVSNPFPLPNPNGCSDSNLNCPLGSGGTYTYIQTLPILTIYPQVTVVIRWELQDQNNKDLVCFIVTARITN